MRKCACTCSPEHTGEGNCPRCSKPDWDAMKRSAGRETTDVLVRARKELNAVRRERL